MNAKEFAAMLNGREYMKEISKAESAQAKAAGLIVAFGASDDNLELRGACYDEVSAYDGTLAKIRLDNMEVADDEEGCPVCLERAGVIKVHAEWCPKDLKTSWRITPSVPFEPFDIMEDGELFCRGAVFAIPTAPTEIDGDTLLRLAGDLARAEKQYRETRVRLGGTHPTAERAMDIMRQAGDRLRDLIDGRIPAAQGKEGAA